MMEAIYRWNDRTSAMLALDELNEMVYMESSSVLCNKPLERGAGHTKGWEENVYAFADESFGFFAIPKDLVEALGMTPFKEDLLAN
jgi:hypothetical protein